MTGDVEKILRDYYEAWSSHDVDRIASFLADDFIYEDVPTGSRHSDIDEFKARWRAFLKGCPDFRVQWETLFATGNMAGGEWIMSGTQTGDWPMMPATGKSFALRGAAVIELKDGKIKRNAEYWDMMSLMQQLGSMPGDTGEEEVDTVVQASS